MQQSNRNQPNHQREANSKKKVTLRLDHDEVAVIWKKENWDHMIMVYETLAKEALPGDEKYWLESANWVKSWIAKARKHVPRSA